MIKFSDNLEILQKNVVFKINLRIIAVYVLLVNLTLMNTFASIVGFEKSNSIDKVLVITTDVQINIQGTVNDSNGTPLPGVNILIQGTNSGTQTDFDGAYSIEASKGDILVFSYVGLTSVLITVDDSNTIDVTMQEEANTLDEVIIVGYGTQTKASLTGSVTNIKTEEIAEISSSNLTSALAGRLSGVGVTSSTGAPGVASNLTIRTIGTWNNAQPVYVIDGVVRNKSDFDNLDVNEVAEISILKDAASAAVYGSRAANGVVLVSTKIGKSGKPTITYNTSYNFEKPTKLPDMMSAVDIAQLANDTYNEYFPEGTPFWRDFTHWTDEDIAWLKTVNNGYGYDYLGELYKDPESTKHSLGISGGTDDVKYYVGGSMFKQSGFLEPLKYNKQNFRANVEVKLSDNLTASANLAVVNSKREKFNWLYDWGGDDLGDLWKKLQTWQYYEPISIDGKAPNLGWLGNVGELINNSGYWRNRTQNQSGVVSLNYDIPKVEGLSIKGTYAFNRSSNNLKNFYKGHTTYGIQGHTLHNYSQVEFTGDEKYNQGSYREGINESAGFSRSYQLNAQINYEKTFGDHHLDAFLVYEQYEGFGNSFSATRYDFPILVRDQWNQTSGDAENSRASGGESEDGRLSYIGKLNYDFHSKYYLSASFRYDGSLIFAPENRWGFFPSISGAWMLSQEDFFNVDFIERLKIKGSFGTLGNDRVDPWRWQEQYVSSSGYHLGVNPSEVKGIRYGGITNRLQTWETSKATNFGLDLLLTNKIRISLDLWNKKTTDILGAQDDNLPSTVGGTLPNVNYGEMKSGGIDLEVDYNNSIGDFDYYVGVNYGKFSNEVVEITQAENIRDYQDRIGRAWSYIVGYVDDGILRTQADVDALPSGYTIGGQVPQLGQINYKDLSGPDGSPDGKIDSWDQTVIADNAAPTSTFGLKLGGSFKGFSVDALFQGAGGYKKVLSVQPPFPWTRVYGIWEDYWSPENPNSSMPNPNWNQGANQWTSTFWLKDANYIRLRYLNIGYELPQSIIGKTGLDRVKLYVSGTNLLTISDFKDYDVELGHAGAYPNMKNYSLGINVTF